MCSLKLHNSHSDLTNYDETIYSSTDSYETHRIKSNRDAILYSD